MTDTFMFFIPATEYIRPHGESSEGHMLVRVTTEQSIVLSDALEAMQNHGITITLESLGEDVLVCFDDGECDYKQFVFTDDVNFPSKIRDEVLAFSISDYLSFKKKWNLR